MNTTTAAQQAGVTIPTIRHWCRYGAIAATKTAGRWTIDPASLNRRIQIGTQQRARKAQIVSIDLTKALIKIRNRNGVTITSVRDFAPLLADKIDAITDEGDRLHTLTVLARSVIAIRDQAMEDDERGTLGYETFSDYGRLATTYAGTPDLPIETVLELAAQIRATL